MAQRSVQLPVAAAVQSMPDHPPEDSSMMCSARLSCRSPPRKADQDSAIHRSGCEPCQVQAGGQELTESTIPGPLDAMW